MRGIVFVYLGIVAAVFLVGYGFMKIREMGLYQFMLVINLPGSLAVEPMMESLGVRFGWSLGQPIHVFVTQLLCMTVNGVLLASLIAATTRLVRGRREA